jgi:hypothetical protein
MGVFMSERGFGGFGSPDQTNNPKTYEEILNNPFTSEDEKNRIRIDTALGQVAMLLLQRGERDTAALLLDVVRFTTEWDPEARTNDVWLEVAPENYGDAAAFSEDVVARIREVFQEVARRTELGFDWLGVREILPEVGPEWREQFRSRLSGKRPTNHARRVRANAPQFVEDYLSFTNQGELTVYRALKQIQENDLPQNDTIGIYPLAGGRVPHRTWEPDVLVTYKGRAGVIEIDGPHHNRRRALDTTRDHLLRDAGIGFVDRITVEAISSPAELTASLLRFLRRLSEVR